MKVYAIKRFAEVPYCVSWRRDIDLYPTLEGAKKALNYHIKTMKRYTNRDVSNEFKIVEYELTNERVV